MRLLDLFFGAGGAAMGYHQAGFTEIVGVDINPQPNYPFKFQQLDALDVLVSSYLDEFDLIHTSPPCQSYSRAMKHLSHPQPMLVEKVRRHLEASGKPWSPRTFPARLSLPRMTCSGHTGSSSAGLHSECESGVTVLFETSFPVAPLACNHESWRGSTMNPNNQAGRDRIRAGTDEVVPDLVEVVWRREMGVEWMGRYEAREAIPPAYTKYIGEAFVAQKVGV